MACIAYPAELDYRDHREVITSDDVGDTSPNSGSWEYPCHRPQWDSRVVSETQREVEHRQRRRLITGERYG
jgi:hypothetical protein